MNDKVPAAEPLRGGVCEECGAVAFPLPTSCARCASESIVVRDLPERGSLWTFTVQAMRPTAPYHGPDEFVPFGVGYIDLGGEVLVEAVLTENRVEFLHIDMPMRLVSSGSLQGAPVFAPAIDGGVE